MIISLLFIFLSTFFSSLNASSSTTKEILEVNDIQKVMNEIFRLHLEKKQLTPDLLKISVVNYINQFDPYRIYLLESEIQPFLILSKKELEKSIKQYNNNEMPLFISLNQLFQKAINRSREARAVMEDQPEKLILTALKNSSEKVFPNIRPFATSTHELNERTKKDIQLFIQSEVSHFGKSRSFGNPHKLMSLYEEEMNNQENPYLVFSSENTFISPDKENFFVIHVLKSLSTALDAHTSVLDISEAQEMRMRLQGQAQVIQKQDTLETDSIPFDNGIIGKLTLHSFYDDEENTSSVEDLRKALNTLEKKGPLKGIILDLRDNMGGFLDQAIKVTGLFITNGIVVISKYSDGKERIYRDIENDVAFKGPLIILTSKETASAAEIVAQTLQDYGIALIVGDEQTYGKGTIQSQTTTSKKAQSFFKVTVGKYYTVSGKTPQNEGVKADIIVPSSINHKKIGEKYLGDTLSVDEIPPMYQDTFADIPWIYKGWYLHHYLPTLQPKITTWHEMLPILRKNSAKRQNLTFSKKNGSHTTDEENNEPFEERIPFSANDAQMKEAINIMKDMITFDKDKDDRKKENSQPSNLQTTMSSDSRRS